MDLESSKSLDHAVLATPTTALWKWLYEVDPDYPSLYLEASGHLKVRTATEMLEACEEVLDGRLRPAPLGEDSSEAARVMNACGTAFARGYGLDELAEWQHLSRTAAWAALSEGEWTPLTAAERRFYLLLREALSRYLELREDVRCYPQWSGVDFSARQLRTLGIVSHHRLFEHQDDPEPADPFAVVELPTTALWPWLDDVCRDYPDSYLDGWGHLDLDAAAAMIGASERLATGQTARWDLFHEEWPAFADLVLAFVEGYDLIALRELEETSQPFSYDEEATVDVLSSEQVRFWRLLNLHLAEYVRARVVVLEPGREGRRLYGDLVMPIGVLRDRLEDCGVDPGLYLDARDGHLAFDTAADMVAACDQVLDGAQPHALAGRWPHLPGLVEAFISGYGLDVDGELNPAGLGLHGPEEPTSRHNWEQLRTHLYGYRSFRSLVLDRRCQAEAIFQVR